MGPALRSAPLLAPAAHLCPNATRPSVCKSPSTTGSSSTTPMITTSHSPSSPSSFPLLAPATTVPTPSHPTNKPLKKTEEFCIWGSDCETFRRPKSLTLHPAENQLSVPFQKKKESFHQNVSALKVSQSI